MKKFTTLTLLLTALPFFACADDVTLTLSNSSQSDTLHLEFTPGATTGFDNAVDQTCSPVQGNGHNYIYSEPASNTFIRRNNVPLPDSSYALPLGLFIQAAGYSDITLQADPNVPAGTLFALEDAASHNVTVLQPGVPLQQFLLTNNLSAPVAYILHVFPSPQISTTATTCSNDYSGTIHIDFGHSTAWTTSVYDSGNTLVFACNVSGSDTTITGFPADNYTVRIGNGVAEYDSLAAVVSAPAPVDASFEIPDTLYTGTPVAVQNNASSGNAYTWDFGETGNPVTGMNPNYTYSTPGSYIITQTVVTPQGCTGSFGHKVEVVQGITTATGNSLMDNGTQLSVSTSGESVVVRAMSGSVSFTAEVFDMAGKRVGSVVSHGEPVILSVPANGIYIVRAATVNGNDLLTRKIYISSF